MLELFRLLSQLVFGMENCLVLNHCVHRKANPRNVLIEIIYSRMRVVNWHCRELFMTGEDCWRGWISILSSHKCIRVNLNRFPFKMYSRDSQPFHLKALIVQNDIWSSLPCRLRYFQYVCCKYDKAVSFQTFKNIYIFVPFLPLFWLVSKYWQVAKWGRERGAGSGKVHKLRLEFGMKLCTYYMLMHCQVEVDRMIRRPILDIF